jgi:hypothetical protein
MLDKAISGPSEAESIAFKLMSAYFDCGPLADSEFKDALLCLKGFFEACESTMLASDEYELREGKDDVVWTLSEVISRLSVIAGIMKKESLPENKEGSQ